ncbi:Aspartyl protease [Handroanthus impetiginosus]|uniref:Aspartyl protease n=1 Tax=Handroanthus impetiginosus TaxID=429701 RepID=A0A2G9H0Z9_9LAMI|nr:Aspartyl protease [Handroanthus impetiginosus]
MAKNTYKLVPLSIFTIFLPFLLIENIPNSNALSIKLIHRHSLESPFYPGKISRNERIRLQLQSASAYANRLSTTISLYIKENTSRPTTLIRPKMDNQGLMYLVQVGFGTFYRYRFHYYKYFLHLDTASDLTWAQCDECRRMGPSSCFLQAPPLFPARLSLTYRPLLCDRHPFCVPGECINYICSYQLRYGDGATTLGYLAYESLTFDSDRNKTETVRNVVFGCGIKNRGFMESSKHNIVAGNFGLGSDKRSFLRQKESLTHGRFSYCLPLWQVAHNSNIFLRLGDDIPDTKALKSTPLMSYPDFSAYFVNLKGISVGNRKINIPTRMLVRQNNFDGGCMVDSGSSITILPPPVYEKLREFLMNNHFLRYKRNRSQGFYNFCYFLPKNKRMNDLPNITFHLQDSDLVFLPQVGYVLGRSLGRDYYFCLGIIPQSIYGLTIIGAMQQANMRFIFDTVKQRLYFGQEDCALGA